MKVPPVVSILKGVFALALIGALIWWIPLDEVASALSNLTVSLAIYLILISVVLLFISVMKWKTLIRTQGKDESTVRLFGLYLMGYFFNLMFPSMVGGDAIRSWYLGKSLGQREAAAATFLERYSGFFAMLTLGVTCMWFTSVVTNSERLTVTLIFSGFMVASVLLSSKFMVKALASLPKIGGVVAKQAELFQQALRISTKKWFTVIVVLVYSFLFYGIAVVNVIACALAVGWVDIPVLDVFVVLPVILLISALPIAPQGIGLQEGAFVYYLTLLGATSAEALGIALIIRAKAYLLAFFGGIWWLIEGGRSPEELSEPPAA